MSPVAQSDGHDEPGLIGELVPRFAAVVEDVAVGGEDAVGDPVLPQELPDVFHGVQLRRLGREQHEGDVGRDHEPLRLMPARLVHQDEGMRPGGNRLRDPEREVQTGIGPVPVSRVRIRDRGASDPADRVRFSSTILPKWARRTRSLDALLPILYLRGVSTGDFQEALAALLGKDAPNLSPSVVTRLTATWADEYARWQARDLSARRYVYLWADGVYLQARMEEQAECVLVLIGATHEGKKELVGFQVGVRESAQSWRELLVEVKRRGLAIAPEIAVGDGALGFWRALDEVFPGTHHQRCWQHKTANVLNKVPKSVQRT